MSDKKKIYKPSPVSGFPEWLPEVRIVEQQWLDHIRKVFESYGFCSIETPAVEELNVIGAKGEDVDKEIYVIERLHKDENDTKEARLALHFDQTVPFARYAAQHFNDLVFPFKRYQMQKVWRGERPQAGRMREFYQCDIDVINPDNLPIAFDAEMPAIIWEVLSSLPCYNPETKKNVPLKELENIQIRVSNRKILTGYIETLGIQSEEMKAIIFRTIDKLTKEHLSPLIVGMHEALKECNEDPSIDTEQLTDSIMEFIKIAKNKFTNADEFEDALKFNSEINTSNETLQKGIEELSAVLDNLSHLPEGAVVADLSIVRGLDYYTGTVYETVFTEDPTYGSICSGGRYDDLAGSYINKHLPGVGISIGFSRLFDRLRTQGKLPVSRKCPTDVLIIPPRDEADLPKMKDIETTLRGRGINVEIAHGKKMNKQMAYAEKKGIPYVWFPEDDQVKDMRTGEQSPADPHSWNK
ncbi:MAG: histidine--tRNA ligase [Micavibrio sp.]|nr:histidine--tRNA ligase [Micavibrio sp.]